MTSVSPQRESHSARPRVGWPAAASTGPLTGIAAALAGLVASWLLRPFTGHTLLFVLLFTIGAVTWADGRRAGVSATVTAVGGAALLLATGPSLNGWTFPEAVTLLTFAVAGVLLTRIVDSLREARRVASRFAVQHAAQADELRRRLADVEALGVDLRAANAALERARGDAEEAGRVKGDFLHVMSHELRTPLNAIGGYAELMAMGIAGPVTPEQRDYLARVQRSQHYLLGLVNSVLNLAKLEADAVPFVVAPVAIGGVAEAAAELVLPQCALKGLAFDRAPVPHDLCALADPEKVEQVLVNLLGNAVKFTPAGGAIVLGCEARGDVVRLTVRDTGPGIAADRLAAIFEPFVQVDSAAGARAAGTGLGLTISRGLARGMGGDLTVESTPGRGSAFTLTLPRAAGPTVDRAADRAAV